MPIADIAQLPKVRNLLPFFDRFQNNLTVSELKKNGVLNVEPLRLSG